MGRSKSSAKARARTPKRERQPRAATPPPVLDRDLSWLDFNRRVLDMAADPAFPLGQRLHFAAIAASNLDEFCMVRVAHVRRQALAGRKVPYSSGLTPRALHKELLARIARFQNDHCDVISRELFPGLAREAGVHVVDRRRLTRDKRSALDHKARSALVPLLSPLAVDDPEDPPYVAGGVPHLVVCLTGAGNVAVEDDAHVALVPLGASVPRFVSVPGQGEKTLLVPVEQAIEGVIDDLFEGHTVRCCSLARLTRSGSLGLSHGDGLDMLAEVEKGLERRRHGDVVRLEVSASMPTNVASWYRTALGLKKREVITVPGFMDARVLETLVSEHPSIPREEPFELQPASALVRLRDKAASAYFAAIATEPILVHHPYESFTGSVQKFVARAAEDPAVKAIKQTLYRTSGDSPIVESLIQAARAGKDVLAVVEVQARFDEANNISWARKMEEAGVHVVLGPPGLKTHAKMVMVVREERGALTRYCHIGTGNYHPERATVFEDFSLFTADPRVGADVARLFNMLSGYGHNVEFNDLLVAPRHLRQGLLRLIHEQTARAKQEKRARIRLKCNALVDDQVIAALYAASAAGVPIDIVVRGMCGLRPGVKGLSDTIRVRSVLGRFLEHSRIYEFGEGKRRRVLMGSADLMQRSMERRVEVLVPMTHPAHRDRLSGCLDVLLSKKSAAWELGADGSWTSTARTSSGARRESAHDRMLAHETGRGKRI